LCTAVDTVGEFVRGVWNRGFGPFKPVLEQYWLPYIRGRGTFDEAIAAVLAHLGQ